MWQVFSVILAFLILFINGGATLFFLSYLKPKGKFSKVEVVVYSFSLGYAVLTLLDLVFAQFNFFLPSVNIVIISILPVLAVLFYFRQNRKKRNENQEYFSSSTGISPDRLFQGFLLAVFALGIVLRFESQWSVTWLGDMDPYYHLTFIDSIVMEGTLPSRTLWGFYSYPPSFHLVFSSLLSATQIDRFVLMKTVPEFLGFLSVPAAYILIKRKYGDWAGIAAAAFLSINSFHIYRTNIAIPEPLALLGMLMFFHAVTTQEGAKKYLLGGFFASMVLLTNVVGIIYFVPSVLLVSTASLLSKRWKEAVGLGKALLLGLLFSGLFWLPTLYNLGLDGVLEGLGPSYASVWTGFTTNTYFSWIGWGGCVLATAGVFVCLRDYKNHYILLIPTALFIFLIEAANNGYYLIETNLIFRGLLYVGTWVSLLAGVGFARIMKTQRRKVALTALVVIFILTVFSFPLFSKTRYPVNWENDSVDFVYRSYTDNYRDIFEGKDYKVYSGDPNFNYGAFNNVILEREFPQMKEAASRNDTEAVLNLIDEYNIRYLIILSETTEAEFLKNIQGVHVYYENWYTVVFGVE